MAINRGLIGELKNEGASTRKMVERVPTDKLDWRPHEKSMTLGRLATHIAELPIWIPRLIESNEWDGTKTPHVTAKCETTESIVRLFDETLQKAMEALNSLSDESMNLVWTMRRGEYIIFHAPRKVALRSLAFNHIYHHRGQLSVYLRLLDIPVPGMYGPSADEKK